MNKPRIVVVGSINMDLVARMPRLPRPGETVAGSEFQTIPGGKGANQAVAAARLGASVVMIGRVGDDAFASQLRNGLSDNGVDTTHVLATPDCSSGVALIGVEQSGANAITVIAGANGKLSPDDILQRRQIISEADLLVVQLETPLEAVAAAIRIARDEGLLTILDPAPAPLGPLPHELMVVDVISPNQTEAEALTGIAVTDVSSARLAALRLRELGARAVVLKLGELGAFVIDEHGSESHVPASKADVVDTTAAGDAFTAGLAVELASGKPLVEATRFACAAGTKACTKFGAQPAMPTRAELYELLA